MRLLASKWPARFVDTTPGWRENTLTPLPTWIYPKYYVCTRWALHSIRGSSSCWTPTTWRHTPTADQYWADILTTEPYNSGTDPWGSGSPLTSCFETLFHFSVFFKYLLSFSFRYLPPPPVLTPSGGHQNRYSWQADGTHPTGMLSCDKYLWIAS